LNKITIRHTLVKVIIINKCNYSKYFYRLHVFITFFYNVHYENFFVCVNNLKNFFKDCLMKIDWIRYKIGII